MRTVLHQCELDAIKTRTEEGWGDEKHTGLIGGRYLTPLPSPSTRLL